jgi:hypothetical protein
MLDLDLLDTTAVDAGSWLELEVPPALADADSVRIKLLGIDSEAYRKAVASYRRTIAKLRVDIGDESPEGRSADAELYAAVTLEWSGLTQSGKAWPCTRDNAKKLYITQPWITRQVRAFVGTDGNFITARPQPKPPKSS